MLPILLAAALAIPPVAQEAPASEPVVARAVDRSANLHIVSNGVIALAVWDRDAAILGCRIDLGGNVLDPVPFVIAAGSDVADVFVDRDHFEVLSGRTGGGRRELVTFDVLGQRLGAVSITARGAYKARSGDGPDAKFLFADVASGIVEVADREGNVRRSEAYGFFAEPLMGASDGQRFLLLYPVSPASTFPKTASEYVAWFFRLDASLAVSTHIDVPRRSFDSIAMSADGHGGYAVATRNGGTVTLDHLDARARFVSSSTVLQQPATPHPTSTTIHATLSHGQLIVSVPVSTTTSSVETWLSRDSAPAEKLGTWQSATEVAFDPAADLALTSSSELVVQQHGGRSAIVDHAAAPQWNPAVAAGANGFLVVWTEQLAQAGIVYARRFDTEGRPQEEPRIVTIDAASVQPRVASDGKTYIVAWANAARRMDARSGEWRDTQPFALKGTLQAALSGSALTLSREQYGTFDMWMSRTVSLEGPAIVDPPRPLGASFSSVSAFAGADSYLFLFAKSSPTGVYELQRVSEVSGARARRDGVLLEAPRILSTTPASAADAAWDGHRWLAAWTDAVMGVGSASIDAAGSIAVSSTSAYTDPFFVRAFAHAGEAWLLSLGSVQWAVGRPNEAAWQPLDTATNSMINTASNGGTLLFVFTRIDERNGYVPRVIVQARRDAPQ